MPIFFLVCPGTSPGQSKQRVSSYNISDNGGATPRLVASSQMASPRTPSHRSQSSSTVATSLPQSPRIARSLSAQRVKARSQATSCKALSATTAKLEAHNLDDLSLESLMADKRNMAARWHPPMALPSFSTQGKRWDHYWGKQNGALQYEHGISFG